MTSDGALASRLFHYPEGATAALAARAQLELWRSAEGRRLFPYFALLETHVRPGEDRGLRLPRPRRAALAARLPGWLPGWPELPAREKLRRDVLIAGDCRNRETEYRLMSRILLAAVDSGRTVLYLTAGNEEEHRRIRDTVQSAGIQDRVTLVDVLPPDRRPASTVLRARGRLSAFEDWHCLAERLPDGLVFSDEAYDAMAGIATVRLAWRRLRERVEFGTALVRCHFTPLGASVAEAEMDRPATVVTTQHGVICSPTWSPILADRYICFGASSADFARRLDREVAERSSRPALCTDYLPSGSLYDPLPPLHPRTEPRTLLVIDQNTRRGSLLLGMHEQNREFAEAVELALERCRNLDRVLIRPHPDNREMEGWRHLPERHPGRVVFSRPGSKLEDDMAESSVVAGMFSGATVTAAACGLPTVFVWREGWYYTGDLECFRDSLFTHPDRLPGILDDILASPAGIRARAEKSRDAARQYYHEGAECPFDREWAERALAPAAG